MRLSKQPLRDAELACKSNQRVLWPQRVRLSTRNGNSIYGDTPFWYLRFSRCDCTGSYNPGLNVRFLPLIFAVFGLSLTLYNTLMRPTWLEHISCWVLLYRNKFQLKWRNWCHSVSGRYSASGSFQLGGIWKFDFKLLLVFHCNLSTVDYRLRAICPILVWRKWRHSDFGR